MAKLCILCCYSYQSGGDGGDNLEAILKENPVLKEFCKEVKSDWNGLVNSLENEWNEVSICGECMAAVDKAVEVRRQMEEMEGEVRRLQRELLEKMRRLKSFVEGWKEELRRMEGIVKGGDLGALESRRRTKRRRVEKEEDGVEGFRRRIEEVALEVQAFCGDLEVKTGGLVVSGRTRGSRRKRKLEEIEEDLEDGPVKKEVTMEDLEEDDRQSPAEDNPMDLCEVNLDDKEEDEEEEEIFSEAQDSESDSNYSDDEEYCSKKKKKGKGPSDKTSKSTSTSGSSSRSTLLKSLDTSTWPPFQLRLMSRLLKRNKNSFTAPPPPPPSQDPTCPIPPPGHQLSFNPTTNQLSINSIPILIKSDVTIPGGGGYLQCTLCNYISKPSLVKKTGIYTDESVDKVMMIHVNGHHLDRYQCPLCMKILVNPKRYREHLKCHQNEFNCPVCGKPCSRGWSLRAHQWSHFNEEERQAAIAKGEVNPRDKWKNVPKSEPYVCVTCGKIFKDQAHLRQHEETHKLVREMIICPQCGKHMLKKSYITYHKKNCPGSPVDQNKVHCLICDVSFKTKQFLKRHMRRIHSQEAQERNWRCEVCSKAFRNRGDLLSHQKTHGEGRIWRCEKGCGKEFIVKRYWKRHVKSCPGIGK